MKIKELKKNIKINELILINFISLSKKDKYKPKDWRNNEDIKKWMCNDHVITKKEHDVFINNLNMDNKNFYWIVKNIKEEKLGVIYLNNVDFNNKNAYLGLYKNPELNSKEIGIGTQLLKIIVILVFKLLKFHTLRLEVLKDNKRAINLYEKFGFTKEGILKEEIFKDKIFENMVITDIKAKEILNEL
jgi:UDP-4-amino-4,6-dideoxy-N-acetyl-beta-L-altrosamine N-acetyltransferase